MAYCSLSRYGTQVAPFWQAFTAQPVRTTEQFLPPNWVVFWATQLHLWKRLHYVDLSFSHTEVQRTTTLKNIYILVISHEVLARSFVLTRGVQFAFINLNLTVNASIAGVTLTAVPVYTIQTLSVHTRTWCTLINVGLTVRTLKKSSFERFILK